MTAEIATTAPIQTVALCGSGLALWMTAAAMARSVPDSVDITIVETGINPAADMLYGHVLPPQAYAFHLSIGVSEPELLLNTGTTFALGTHFQNWAQTGRSWVQAFHQPFPVWNGVPLTKLINQLPHATLQSTLISAQAAIKGVFAHPSEDPRHPLSRAEYGYAVDPNHLSALYKAAALRRSMTVLSAQIDTVQRETGRIATLKLSNGESVSADLFIDCTGPSAQLHDGPTANTGTARTVQAKIRNTATTQLGPAAQVVRCNDDGWRSDVTLRSGTRRLTVSDAAKANADNQDSDDSVVVTLGARDKAWTANSVAVGHAACVIEPFTTAPIKLLFRDIDRIISLFPVSTDMQIEAQEYNRMATDDCVHAHLFNQAHFATSTLPDTPFWQTAAAHNDQPKLVRKLLQYESRGHLVAYDHEPFDGVDWAILHDGMGRKPRRPDPLAAMVDPAITQDRLDDLDKSIQAVVQKMPPHPVYMGKFLSYVKRKHSHNG